MRHEAGIDHVLHPELLQLGIERGLFERARVILHHHGLAFDRRHDIGDLPDRRLDVIRGARACIMHDVDHRAACGAEAFEQGSGFLQRRLDADELHDAFAIGLLAVDQHERALRNRRGVGVHPGQFAKCRARHASAPPGLLFAATVTQCDRRGSPPKGGGFPRNSVAGRNHQRSGPFGHRRGPNRMEVTRWKRPGSPTKGMGT